MLSSLIRRCRQLEAQRSTSRRIGSRSEAKRMKLSVRPSSSLCSSRSLNSRTDAAEELTKRGEEDYDDFLERVKRTDNEKRAHIECAFTCCSLLKCGANKIYRRLRRTSPRRPQCRKGSSLRRAPRHSRRPSLFRFILHLNFRQVASPSRTQSSTRSASREHQRKPRSSTQF